MFRSGYVAILGVPNVGKSTLLNQLLGEKLSIVTPKPQTTRHRILGILNRPHSQILFLDTPGIHDPKKLLNEKMVEAALSSLQDADVICHMIFPQSHLKEEDQELAQKIRETGKPYLLLINQVDTITKEGLLPLIGKLQQHWGPKEIIPISAKTGEGCDVLPKLIESLLPEGPAYYPTDQLTERDMRFLSEEIVREKAMTFLHQEIPYGLTTHVETFEEQDKLAKIHMAIIVERENHKGMVIGAGGRMIKRIGTLARQDLEKWLGKKVHLELFVKVVEGWSKDPRRLKEYGITPGDK
jgi:GTP-binding protein Era